MKYEMVAGLETHIELATNTKIFCGCTTQFGGKPNTHCCPVCIGLPGTLPKLNRQVVRYAILAGLATHCQIANISKMDRKNYCYPDLPKAYQISQYDKPLCLNGYVELSNGRKIRLTRIHIEEDAGKLVHSHGDTYVDYNRGGVPLIEIVSEPDIRSVEEAKEYVEKLQLIMKYIGISDCKMQEGSMRCDVNISVRPQGSEKFGTRTEIKNMNSLSNMVKAMEYETRRQISLLEKDTPILRETLRYNVEKGKTESMRGKEGADDYRYFPEPDLPPVILTEKDIASIRQALPELPEEKYQRYTEKYHIPPSDTRLLIKYRSVAEYFEKAAHGLQNVKTAANWILGPIFARIPTEAEKERFAPAVSPIQLRELLQLLESGKIPLQPAKQILEKMLDTGESCGRFITKEQLSPLSEDVLREACQDAIRQLPQAAEDYKNGKTKALKALLGMVMRSTKGRAPAKDAEKYLMQYLE